MAKSERLMIIIKLIKQEIEYLEWTLANEEFDHYTLQYIFKYLKIPDIGKIIEDGKKHNEMINNMLSKLYEN